MKKKLEFKLSAIANEGDYAMLANRILELHWELKDTLADIDKMLPDGVTPVIGEYGEIIFSIDDSVVSTD